MIQVNQHMRFSTDTILLLICFILSNHAAIEMTVLHYKVNGHCLLFGRIFEKKRLFIDGYPPLCWLYMFSQYFLGVVAITLSHKSLQEDTHNWQHNFKLRKTVFGTISLSCLMSILFSYGFYSVCNSLDYAPVCNQETIWNMEFKYFSPKYFDANQFFSQFKRIMISNWICTSFWLILAMVIWRKRIK